MGLIDRVIRGLSGQATEHAAPHPCGICGSHATAERFRQPPWSLWTCSRCGVWFSLTDTGDTPTVRPSGDPEFREQTWSKKPYIDSLEEFVRYYDPLLAKLEEFVAPGRLLDVGCGPGFAMEAARRRRWQAVGLDPAPFPASYVPKTLGLEVIQAALEDASIPEASFDAVLLIHSIEHVPDPVRTMTEVARVLRPEGVVFVETPNSHSEASRYFGDGWPYLNLPEHTFIFDPASTALLFHRAGLRVLEIQAPVRRPNPHGAVLWAWAERPGPPRHPTAGRSSP